MLNSHLPVKKKSCDFMPLFSLKMISINAKNLFKIENQISHFLMKQRLYLCYKKTEAPFLSTSFLLLGFLKINRRI
jgi:hypothetical protein